ncbi:alpha/beta fold hydrolase [Vibrio bivalvicida]|uniref:Alpha/beta hydrolase n=1 Tax=Vibrio bivalvicida TaxID=1276888 RepID=A0A177Y284_9VIBR|nr:alpha/beta fold hydrolase [Vibrio bivalvicida]OAJ94716.1 alpha/beta hydrolase [Vibrio bivalvicida]
MNRKLAVLAIATAIAGCGGGDEGSTPSTTSNNLLNLSTLSNASAELQTVQCNQLQLVGKNYVQPNTVDSCWLLQVPEDYAQPNGKKIQIAVAKTSAQGAKKGSFVFLDGGPGGMSLSTAGYSNSHFPALSSNHDIYFVDQRGTGYSTPSLSCDFGDSGTTQQIKDCKSKYTNNGVVLDQYTNVNNALDLLVLEKKLTQAKQLDNGWKLYGVSYGTRLAMTMAREEQKQINSGYQTSNAIQMMVLDGVFPIEVNGIKDMPWSNYESLDRLLEVCRRSGIYCNENTLKSALNTRLGEIGEQYRLPLLNYLVQESMSRTYSVQGDKKYEPVALLNLTKAQIESDIISMATDSYSALEPDMFTGMGLSNICAEEPVKPAHHSVHPSRGKWGANVQSVVDTSHHLGLSSEACEAWSVSTVSASNYASMTPVTYPVLLLSGANDGQTPPAWADVSSTKFSNKLSLVSDDGGHGIITDARDGENICLKDIVLSAINNPETMRDINTSCLNTSNFKYTP